MKTKSNRQNPYDLNALAKDLSQNAPKQIVQIKGSNPYDTNTVKITGGDNRPK